MCIRDRPYITLRVLPVSFCCGMKEDVSEKFAYFSPGMRMER